VPVIKKIKVFSSGSAVGTFTGIPADLGDVILTDAEGTQDTFRFNNGVISGSFVLVDTSTAGGHADAAQLFTNAVNSASASVKISAVRSTPGMPSTFVTLTQTVVGPGGNTSITDSATNVSFTSPFTGGQLRTTADQIRSGITSLPPRIILRNRDSATGSYPTIVRTGDTDRKGSFSVIFDDNNTILFEERLTGSAGNIGYPEALVSNSKFFGDHVASPNTSSDIVTFGTVRKGVADDNVSFTPGEDLSPFVENRINLKRTSYYATGTNPSILDGFSSPLWSKTQIRINIPATEESVVSRNVARVSDVLDPSGEFAGQDLSGFLYYNFEDKKWEQKGLTDPATGNPTHFNFALSITDQKTNGGKDKLAFTSGTNDFPSQFSGQPQATTTTLSTMESLGYGKIATPTVMAMAPFANKYHATSSQTLKMSSLISSPFVLEKVVLKIPVVARRKHTSSPATFGRKSLNASFADDYVFFLYRQGRSARTADSSQDVSSSLRFLICSGAASFYNSESFLDLPPSGFRQPIHTPSFSHDFDIKVSFPPINGQGLFTGSISMEMIPAVVNKQFSTFSPTPNSSNLPITASYLQNWWPGGTTSEPFFTLDSGYTGKDGQPANYENNILSKGIREIFSGTLLPAKQDGRSLVSPLGGGLPPDKTTILAPLGFSTDIDTPHSRISPYLLMPEDELILGVEGLIGSDVAISGWESYITGSILKLMPGEANITLYGSQIREGVEFHDTLNQPLTSDAIHEMIHYDNPVLDQFDVEDRQLFSGSMKDEVVSGSIFSTDEKSSRQVVGSRVNGMSESTVSFGLPPESPGFIRAVQAIDDKDRFFDTIPPDFGEIINLEGTVPKFDTTYNFHFVGLGAAGIDGQHRILDWPRVFPFEPRYSRITRAIKKTFQPVTSSGDTIILNTIATAGGNYIFPNGALIRGYRTISSPFGKAGIERFVFGTGRGPEKMVNLIDDLNFQSGAMGPIRGWKYGLMGVSDIKPRCLFRRDRYGQFRDLLEQRIDSKFFDVSAGSRGVKSSPVKIRFVSGSSLTTPSLTDSSNLNFEASSSLPYFDGISRN